jgi:alkylation response protein AidB-like acyl-CoA dehydrogenase
MDFEQSEEQKMVKKNCHDFMEKEIIPLVDEYDRRGPLTKEESTMFIKKLIPLGYITGPIPEEYGGLAIGFLSYGLMLEELAYAWAGLSSLIHITGLEPLTLVSSGTEELREKYLAPLLAGDIIACQAITEPNAGSGAPRGIQTTAVLGDGEYVVNGTKAWITNGGIADIVEVLCVTDKTKGSSGISSILVDRRVSPFTTRELHKLGWHASSIAELYFDDCHVPEENLISSGEGGIIGALNYGRSMLGIRSCGVAQAAIDASVKYAQERVQFGKPIGSFQMIQEMIADMVMETQAARFLALHALDLLDKGIACPKEASMAKAFGCEMVVDVTSKAVQIHGAAGLDEELPVERYFRDARVFTIPDGTTQIQKLIIGRETLGIKAFR